MKISAAVLLSILTLPAQAIAEDNDDTSSILQIQGGKVVGEQQEIEIYDYHSGVYQTVNVYRKPEKTEQAKPEAPGAQQPSPAKPK